ncbi:MAG: hypothetical protein KGL59_02525 [Acidobacteriota bacterium]|nr:hypothetical protein [Acidobacteriota bacterium]
MRRKIFGSLAVALALLMVSTAARADDWSKTFSVTAKPHLTVDADNARLNVITGASNAVVVHVATTGWQIPKDVKVTETQNGNDIRVEVKQVQHWMTFSHGTTAVDVTVPAQADLDLSTGNGEVTLGAVTGMLQVGTGNGHITATGSHGNVYLRTGNGRIEASGIDGRLSTHTGNGSVTVTGRFDSLNVDSGRGEVRATVLPGSKMTSDWRVGTGVGGVTVNLPSDFSAELDGSTGVGHITVDFPMTVSGTIAGSAVRGRIGTGGPTLRVHTGVGSIHIDRAS